MTPCPHPGCRGTLKCNRTDKGDPIIRHWFCKVCGRHFKGTQPPEQLIEIPPAGSVCRK